MGSEDSGEYFSCRSSICEEYFACTAAFEVDSSDSALDELQRDGPPHDEPLCEYWSGSGAVELAALNPIAAEWYPPWNYISPLFSLHPTAPISSMNMAALSSSWTSPEATKKARLERLQANAGHIRVVESPFFPQNLSQYLEHEAKWAEQMAAEMMACLVRRQKDKRDVAINFQHSTDPAILFNKGKVKAGGVQKVARTIRTLAENMEIWTLGYEKKEQRRIVGKTVELDMRACWPEQNELKAEGEHRQIVFGERRFPLPRKDEYSTECFKLKLNGDITIWDTVRAPGDNIAWYERAPIQLMGLDRLESTMKELRSEDKTWTVKAVMTPLRQNTLNTSPNAYQRSRSRRGRCSSSNVNSGDRQAFLRSGASTTGDGKAPAALNLFGSNFTPGVEARAGAQQMITSNTWSNFTQRNKSLEAQQDAQFARSVGLADGSQRIIPQSPMRGWGNNAGGLVTIGSDSPGFATSANRAISGHRGRRGSIGHLISQGRGGSTGILERSDRKTSGESELSTSTRKMTGEYANVEISSEPDVFDNFESEYDFLMEKGMGDLLKELQ